jgi:hypothetical protein
MVLDATYCYVIAGSRPVEGWDWNCCCMSRSYHGSSHPIVTLDGNSEGTRAGKEGRVNVYYRMPIGPCCILCGASHRSVGSPFPMLQFRILLCSSFLKKRSTAYFVSHIPLNFLSGIMDSSNFSSSFMRTFLLFPSPMTRRVLPHPKSSMHQKEYTGKKKLYTGYLCQTQVRFIHRTYEGHEDIRKKVDNHPSYQHELALDDEDDSLQTVRSSQHDDGNERERSAARRYSDEQVHQLP